MRITAEMKIIGLSAFSLLAVIVPPLWLATLALVLLLFIIVLKASGAKLLRMLLPALPFIIFICVVQALLSGESAQAALRTATLSAGRMVLLYVAGSAVTATTSETEFTQAIRRLLSPVDRALGSSLGRDISTMMMLAIAFMPAIAEEYALIKMAQEARGVSYRSPLKAVRGIFSIALPLLYSLSARADSIAIAMEARCYGLEDAKL